MLLALAVGCGGDAGNSSAQGGGLTYSVRADTNVTTGPLDKAEFLERADTICRNSQTLILNRFARYRAEQGQIPVPKLIAEATPSLILPAIEFQFDGFYRAGAPEGDEEQVEEMIGAMQFAIESGEKRRISSARRLGGLFTNFNHLARAYGMDRCTVEAKHYGAIWAASEGKNARPSP